MKLLSYLLPVRTFTLKSGLNQQDFEIALKKNVTFSHSLYWNFDTGYKEFHGTKSADEILLRRNITYKNSFLPTIRIKPDHFSNPGTVTIKMWVPLGIMFFWIFCLFAWFFVKFGMILFFHAPPLPFGSMLAEYILPLLISIVFLAAFQIEASIALKKLKHILKLEPVI